MRIFVIPFLALASCSEKKIETAKRLLVARSCSKPFRIRRSILYSEWHSVKEIFWPKAFFISAHRAGCWASASCPLKANLISLPL